MSLDLTASQEILMPTDKITASCKLNGHDLTDVPVINPGGWFGKAWLIEIGGSYTPLFLVVEADSISDAIDELSDDKTYGHQIHVPDADLGDYPEDERHFDGSGRVVDLDHVLVHGHERADLPFPVRYQGDGLPEEGIDPRKYDDRDEQ
ncbi:hypothetical protein TA3x_000535 [Tundrisphaera sp. TA3]|uniref:hypothetical protein n=1 Tax=Tundrisphaera sp. TA3 TaxID=3435775 RepID=UPI003EB9AD5E